MAMGLQRLQLEADELTGEHRRLLDLVLQAVGRANGAVTGLLDFARPVRPNMVRAALDRLIEDQMDLYRQHIDSLGVRLDRRIGTDLRVTADPDLLRQVLDNLMRNALEALAATPGGSLEIRAERQGDLVQVVLANDGLTLDAAGIERILEPWFTTKAAGTGLGMAISQRILDAHGTRLRLSVPRPGRLRVDFSLPLEPPDKADAR